MVTLNEKSCGGSGLSGGARQLARVHHVRVVDAGFSDWQVRSALGYLDVVLVRLADLRTGHEPRGTRCRHAAELRLQLPGLTQSHLPQTGIPSSSSFVVGVGVDPRFGKGVHQEVRGTKVPQWDSTAKPQ